MSVESIRAACLDWLTRVETSVTWQGVLAVIFAVVLLAWAWRVIRVARARHAARRDPEVQRVARQWNGRESKRLRSAASWHG